MTVMMGNRQNKENKWTPVHAVATETAAIRISKRGSVYSICFGKREEDERGRVMFHLRPEDLLDLPAALDEAIEWIAEDMRKERERLDAARDRAVEKKKRYLDNVEARREANRKRAHAHIGGQKGK